MEVSRTSLLVRRIGAYVIDHGSIVVLMLWLFSKDSLPLAGLELIFTYIFLYPLCEWMLNGRTPGKYVFGLTVINGAGGPPTLVQALIRGFARHIEAPLCIIIFFVYTESQRCQRVGDMLSRTYVVPSKDLAQLRTAIQG